MDTRELTDEEVFGGRAPMQRELTDADVFGGKNAKTQGNDLGAFASGIQGFNSVVPFGNRIIAGAAALANAPFTDLSISELYDTARANQKATEEASPNANLAGTALGIAATLPIGFSKAAATTPILGNAANVLQKASTATGNFIRGGEVAADAGKLARAASLGLRAAKGGLVAAPVGALYSYGSSQHDLDSPEALQDAATGAGMAGAAGFALPVAGAALGAGINAVRNKSTALTSDQIRELASESYKRADQSGGTLKGWFTNRFLDEIKDIRPTAVAGQEVPIHPKTQEVIGFLDNLKNKRLTLQDAQNLDEYLGDAIDSFTELGRVNKQGQKILEVQNTLRKMIDEADDTLIEGGKAGFDALKEGRALWSAQAKMRDIEKIIQRADMTDNPATAIKAGFRNLSMNANRMRGYSKAERSLIEKAAKTGVVGDLLRTGGSRLIPILTGATGGGVLGTTVAAGASATSRGLATRNAMLNANKVARAISARAGGSVPSSVMKEIRNMPPKEARIALQQYMLTRKQP